MNGSSTATILASFLTFAFTGTAGAADLREAVVITDRVIQVYARDGRGVYPGAHETTPERIEETPLNLVKTADPAGWRVTSKDDPAYGKPVAPAKVGRKSKGRECVIETPWKPRWTLEHWIYLVLPEPMKPGKTYTVHAEGLFANAKEVILKFDPASVRSEAVHASQIGYSPAALGKYAYVSMWLGDLGALKLDPWKGAKFRLVSVASGKPVFSGNLAMRKPADGSPDGGQPDEQVPAFRTDVMECDFSAFNEPGEYVVSVDRIGCSYPFRIDADAYREPFRAAMRGMYQQRCGTALVKPYTDWTRPICHHPSLKPVFQSRRRYMEGHCDACKEVESTGEKRDVWGGYHDAGDWDREGSHVQIPALLSLVYELYPAKFNDGELNIPESGNGLPDILDEAQWGLDYYKRLQRADGGISVGLFLDSFPDPGEGPGWDTGNWYVYDSDPQVSYRYAAAACHFAFAVAKAGKPGLGVPYVESARKAWDWAGKNQRPGDAAIVRDDKVWAAACLFRATGGDAYHDAFKKDLMVKTPETGLWEWQSHDQQWACFAYAMSDRPETDPALKERLAKATVKYAREYYIDTAAKRTGRYGGNWWQPLTWGFASVPANFAPLVAYSLSKDPAFMTGMQTTCDFMLGGNPLNMCWISRTGRRFPEMLFHPDSWYSPKGPAVAPGIVAQGPRKYEGEGDPKTGGPWDPKWVQLSAYPSAKEWPPLELYFECRTCYPMNETTVYQIAASAASYGALCK
jgi:endoglucanase